MTIWDNMKQKSFSYLLVTHHGGMLCAVCQTFSLWWVDALTHHICRMASRRDELQTWFAVAYVVDSQSVMLYYRGWWAFLEDILHFTALQKHTFCVLKGALSACKRPCFGVPFAVFCKAPDLWCPVGGVCCMYWKTRLYIRRSQVWMDGGTLEVMFVILCLFQPFFTYAVD